MPIQKIVSGGQTGVDRGALDAAIAAGVPHGGWCPLGRRAEDGPIPARYRLVETATYRYRQRTRQNVLDSDGTLILVRGPVEGGTALTVRYTQLHGKPCLVVSLAEPVDLAAIHAWLVEFKIGTLNVAGPRESGAPGIEPEAFALMAAMLGAEKA